MDGDLQDAIQDAQYFGALCDPVPRPTTKLILPTEEEAKAFGKTMEDVTLFSIVKEPVGYYLWKKFVGQDKKELGFIAFIEWTYDFKTCTSRRRRNKYGKKIYDKFISSGSFLDTNLRKELYTRCFRNEHDYRILDLDMLQFQIDYRKAKEDCKVSSENIIREKGGECERIKQKLLSIDNGDDKRNNQNRSAANVMSNLTPSGNTSNNANTNQQQQQQQQQQPQPSSHHHHSVINPLPPDLFDPLTALIFDRLRVNYFDDFKKSFRYTLYLQIKLLEKRSVGERDFAILRVLGRGGFGMVSACKKKDTGRLYALKTMSKKRVKMNHAERVCLIERRLLARINSPFVTNLRYAFQSREDLFLVIDIKSGGDLSYHLRRKKFTQEQVVFYAAQILLGLEHLHSMGIIYRDMKPMNIMLDKKGNAIITDLGLAVEESTHPASLCGTRGYWAPEIILSRETHRPYDRRCDYWSYGCLIYEMLTSKCPFRRTECLNFDPDRHRSIDIATLQYDPPYNPKYFTTSETKSFCRGLLTRDPNQRLGTKGIEEIKNHPFFAKINWHVIQSLQADPPYHPDRDINAASQSSIGEFESIHTELTEEWQQQFCEWEFVNPIALQCEITELMKHEETLGAIAQPASCCNIM